MIYHMLPVSAWTKQPADAPYRGDTLASEGFIHCTGERDLLLQVANRFYRTIPDRFVILSIDEARVQPEVRWEPADGQIFPHIYGALNLDAVQKVITFPRTEDGTFLMPPEWR